MTGGSNRDTRLSSIMPRLQRAVREGAPREARGRVRRLLGNTVHASIPLVRLGEICDLFDPTTNCRVPAEVIGLVDDLAVLTPIGELVGLSSLTEVIATGTELRIPVGSGLLGRTISAAGEPLDEGPWPPPNIDASYPINAQAPSPFAREPISAPIRFGIRSIDGLMTCGRGQRIGIFGEAGMGKSSLLAQIVRGTDASVVVVALVGERGREVREFVERQLGAEGRRRAVVVAATSDRPAMERAKAAHVATAIAEYFRDQGHHVLLLVDSVTRFARAQREIGLAAGEPATRRGFPPSLFSALPRLLERAGSIGRGSITGIYTVLVEGEISLDPVAEEVLSILDGHMILSRELAARNHYPAIDVLRSRSRLMDVVITPEHRADAARIRELLARYAEVELLLRVGEYKSGSDALTDEAVAKAGRIEGFLRQTGETCVSLEQTQQQMKELVA